MSREPRILTLFRHSFCQPLKPLKQEVVILTAPGCLDPPSQFCPNQYGSAADKITHGIQGHYPLVDQKADRLELEADSKTGRDVVVAEAFKFFSRYVVGQVGQEPIGLGKFSILK